MCPLTSMSELETYKLAVVTRLSDMSAEAYKENIRVKTGLEDKAQKIAAVAGVFIAVGVGFLKKENLEANGLIGVHVLLILMFSTCLLIVAVVWSLRVLWVRERPAPLPVGEMVDHAQAGFTQTDFNFENRFALQYLELDYWKRILDEQAQLNAASATILGNAQIALMAAIILAGSALILVLLQSILFRTISFWF